MVKAFICSEFSHYRVVKTGKTSEFDDCEKLAIEDGKHTLLQHQYVILRGNSSQSSARSFSNLPQSTRICSSLAERWKFPPRTMLLTIQRTVCSHTRRTGTCKRSFHGDGLSCEAARPQSTPDSKRAVADFWGTHVLASHRSPPNSLPTNLEKPYISKMQALCQVC